MAEDRGLAEEKALNTTPFSPPSTNLPQKIRVQCELVIDKHRRKAQRHALRRPSRRIAGSTRDAGEISYQRLVAGGGGYRSAWLMMTGAVRSAIPLGYGYAGS